MGSCNKVNLNSAAVMLEILNAVITGYPSVQVQIQCIFIFFFRDSLFR